MWCLIVSIPDLCPLSYLENSSFSLTVYQMGNMWFTCIQFNDCHVHFLSGCTIKKTCNYFEETAQITKLSDKSYFARIKFEFCFLIVYDKTTKLYISVVCSTALQCLMPHSFVTMAPSRLLYFNIVQRAS